MSIFIIGEIGLNHNGELNIAKKLIDVAVSCGCDAVKFQKRNPGVCVPEEQKNILRETPWGLITYLEYRKHVEFGEKEYDEIDTYCKAKGILWFASAWDVDSQKFLRKYDLKYNKIASPMLTHVELLNEVASEKRHTLISTGMSTMDEIDSAISIFRAHRCPFTLMACTSTYPCDISECNVRFVETLANRYPDSIGVGYSGHEKGYLATTLAVAFGATYIEKHITLDRTMWGSDHAASLGPDGLHRLCRDARNVPKILGSGVKVIYTSEEPIRKKLRKF